MNNSLKINLLIFPLLASILLSTVSKLKPGRSVDQFFFNTFSPITIPTSSLRLILIDTISSLKKLGALEKENLDQKNIISRVLSENEYLKQTLSDKGVLDIQRNTFTEVVPVRLSGSVGKFLVTSTLPLDHVKPGQPLVSQNTLLGTVLEVKGKTVTIIPLDSEKIPSFPIHTASGQKGFYKYTQNISQITDIPSQTPLVPGDFVFTDLNEIFPGNLIVGKISRLISVSQEPLQKAELSLFDSISNNPTGLSIVTKP